MEICGLSRQLPLMHISKNTLLASFSILGDVELVDKLARYFEEKLKKIDFDYIVGPEMKVVPLVHELSRRMGRKTFVICRKSVKPYMVTPVVLKPLPFFPKHVRQLVLDGSDAKLLSGRKVVILDDVVSTGVTMRMMDKMMEKVGAKVVWRAAVLRQGEQFPGTPEFFEIAKIPIFKEE